MYGKGKSNSSVPSDSQAREKLALYVYEYLLHVGAQKSAQTFLSEIRWEKNITLGEPPGFLHSWWCVFWDLYCAAPERRETCEHSSEAKAFHDYPFMSPRYPGGPRPPLRIPNQALGGVPGSQPLLPSGMDPTRQQGHPNMGGPMQRMTPPRGMVPLGPQNYGGAMRPPLNALGGPGMPGMNMGPGGGRPWPNPTNANSIPYSSASPGNYVGPPGGGGPPGTPIMPSPADSTNSGDNMYTLMNAVPPGPNRSNFPMGPGSDGPMGGLGGMESHHMNGSLGSGDMDSISKNTFTADLTKRKEGTNVRFLKIATALNPRLKNLKCFPKSERDEVWSMLSEVLKEQHSDAETTEPEPPKKKINLLLVASDSDEIVIKQNPSSAWTHVPWNGG
ncbi:single-stranded DNA-binding protein 2 isoform X2 [Malaclemys terrapin pileata]|uniref:single-stranded DNA-binding protein 2 isoform X2 n=1 Tax=Malaclemys terrapin pileata TaxID=2991368 RepID=UPI0023A8EA3C|nr:single-stranded DNA-binding protein 2 isoform X2 [Malaclemys terrapin pileata]